MQCTSIKNGTADAAKCWYSHRSRRHAIALWLRCMPSRPSLAYHVICQKKWRIQFHCRAAWSPLNCPFHYWVISHFDIAADVWNFRHFIWTFIQILGWPILIYVNSKFAIIRCSEFQVRFAYSGQPTIKCVISVLLYADRIHAWCAALMTDVWH